MSERSSASTRGRRRREREGQLRPRAHRALLRRRPARRARRRRSCSSRRRSIRACATSSRCSAKKELAVGQAARRLHDPEEDRRERSRHRLPRRTKAARAYTLKVLRREAARDRRAVHRFLTANRLVAHGRSTRASRDTSRPARSSRARLLRRVRVHRRAAALGAPRAHRARRTSTSCGRSSAAILEPLAALHKAHLVHGDLKLENVLVASAAPARTSRTVVAHRLRHRSPAPAPRRRERAHRPPRGLRLAEDDRARAWCAVARPTRAATSTRSARCSTSSSPASPSSPHESATDAAFAHLSQRARAAEHEGAARLVTQEIDAFVLSLLAEGPRAPPEGRGRAPRRARVARSRVAGDARRAARSPPRRSRRSSTSSSPRRATRRPRSRSRRRSTRAPSRRRVAEAFATAADAGRGDDDEDDKETKKALLYRAARIFDTAARTRSAPSRCTPRSSSSIPTDEIAHDRARGGPQGARQVRGARRDAPRRSEPGRAARRRARRASGRDRPPLRDASSRIPSRRSSRSRRRSARCRRTTSTRARSSASRPEARRAGTKSLETITEAMKTDALSPTEHAARSSRAPAAGTTQRLGRADMALAGLPADPRERSGERGRAEGMTAIYRRAQQWPELAQALLMARADAAATRAARARSARRGRRAPRDAPQRLRRARAISTPPSSPRIRATPARARRWRASPSATGTSRRSSQLLERRAEARRGAEKAEALAQGRRGLRGSPRTISPRRRVASRRCSRSTRRNLSALKGLDRIFNRTASTASCSRSSSARSRSRRRRARRSTSTSASPASTTRSSSITRSAADALEAILAIDAANDGALTALARHYRALDKWETLVALYEQARHRHAATKPRASSSSSRCARTLAEQIGSPERATQGLRADPRSCSPAHAGALEALAHLREMSGRRARGALRHRGARREGARRPRRRPSSGCARRVSSRRAATRTARSSATRSRSTRTRRTRRRSAALREAYAQRGDCARASSSSSSASSRTPRAISRRRASTPSSRRSTTRSSSTPTKAEAAAKTRDRARPDRTPTRSWSSAISRSRRSRFLEATKHYETLVGAHRRPRRRTTRSACSSASSRRSARRSRSRVARRRSATSGRSSRRAASRPAERRVASRSRQPQLRRRRHQPAHARRGRGAAEARAAATSTRSRARRNVALRVRRSATARTHVRGPLREVRRRCSSARERAEALYRLGESARRSGELDAAIEPLREAADLDPSNPRPLRALAQDLRGEGRLATRSSRIKRQRLEVASGSERFELLLEIGDVDVPEARTTAPRASKTYVAGARRAARRPQAPHEADAALLGGEGLGEARRGRPPPRRLRRGPEAAREVHAHRSDHRRRKQLGEVDQALDVLRPRARVRSRRSRRRSTRPSSSIAARAITTASSGSSRCSSSRRRPRRTATKLVADPRPARRALPEVPERAGAGHRRVRGRAGVRPRGPRARRDARRALRARRRRSTSTRRSRRRRRSCGATRTASRATSSSASSTPTRRRPTRRGASARRSRVLEPRRAGRGALLQEAPRRERGARAGRARRGRLDARSRTGISIRCSRASSR